MTQTPDELMTEFNDLVDYLIQTFDLQFADTGAFLDFVEAVFEELFVPMILGEFNSSDSDNDGDNDRCHNER
jgi:hypothetical protein